MAGGFTLAAATGREVKRLHLDVGHEVRSNDGKPLWVLVRFDSLTEASNMDPAIAVVGLRRESATDQLDIPPAWMAADSGLPAGSQLPDAPFDKLGGVHRRSQGWSSRLRETMAKWRRRLKWWCDKG